MKKISKIIYIIKMFLFIISFYFVFLMLHNILDAKLFGVVFLIIYFVLVLREIIEIFSKKDEYKEDIIYNVMKMGVYLYLLIISIKTTMANALVTRITVDYFKTNYIIISVLMLFILIYNLLEFKSSSK